MSDDKTRWSEWKEKTFGTDYEIWHDGLMVMSVTGLEGERRQQAVEMLLLGVSLGDSHAGQALAEMGEASGAAALREQLEQADGEDRVRLALAVHQLQPEPALAAHLINVLRRPFHWGVRIKAAMGLRHFPAEQVAEALLASVAHDPDYLVRNHCAESFLIVHEIDPPEISKHGAIFGDIIGPKEGLPGKDDMARFARAAEALRALGSAQGIPIVADPE